MAKKTVTPRIRLDYTNMLDTAVGGKHGISLKELEKFEGTAARAARDTQRNRMEGAMPFTDLPFRTDDAADIQRYADAAAAEFDDFVVLGIGGSALGAAALQCALNPPYYNLMTKAARGGRPRLFIEDNVDPARVGNLLEVVNPKKTLFNVVTKSGGTAETMAAFLIVRDILRKKLGAKSVAKHIVATTDISKGSLRKIADKEGMMSFIVPDGVGGRFSALCPVGLLPAAMVGIDIGGLLAGAAAMEKRARPLSLSGNPALLAATLQFLADTNRGKTMQVMFPYSVRLRDIADWYRQLWAESLGKKVSIDGRVVHTGQTPIKALGATDQHSQVQLYNEGPNNKTITFLRVESHPNDIKIPEAYRDIPEVAFLGGHSMGELLNAEQLATEIALTTYQRPNSAILVPEVTANTVGQLIFFMEMQTAFAGALYKVNPFDQPGVEEGKIATNALMGRPGYEAKRKEILSNRKKADRKII